MGFIVYPICQLLNRTHNFYSFFIRIPFYLNDNVALLKLYLLPYGNHE